MSAKPKTRSDSTPTADQLTPTDIEGIIEKAMAAAMNVFRSEIGQRLSTIETRIQLIETQVNDLVSTVDKLGSHIFNTTSNAPDGIITADLVNIKELETVKKQMQSNALHANDNEQYSRRNNLRIKGLAAQTKDDDCRVLAHDFVSKQLHCNIKLDDIEVAHSVVSRRITASQKSSTPPVMLVRFRSRNERDLVMRNRKVLKGSKFAISEDLTSLNMQTLTRFSKNESVEKTWSWNGRLFATLKNGQKLLVRPFQLLEECTVCQ